MHVCGLAPLLKCFHALMISYDVQCFMFIHFMTVAEDRIDPGQTLAITAAGFPSIPYRATESSLNTTCTA